MKRLSLILILTLLGCASFGNNPVRQEDEGFVIYIKNHNFNQMRVRFYCRGSEVLPPIRGIEINQEVTKRVDDFSCGDFSVGFEPFATQEKWRSQTFPLGGKTVMECVAEASLIFSSCYLIR